jgi:hypothetical protein
MLDAFGVAEHTKSGLRLIKHGERLVAMPGTGQDVRELDANERNAFRPAQLLRNAEASASAS